MKGLLAIVMIAVLLCCSPCPAGQDCATCGDVVDLVQADEYTLNESGPTPVLVEQVDYGLPPAVGLECVVEQANENASRSVSRSREVNRSRVFSERRWKLFNGERNFRPFKNCQLFNR